MTKQQENRTFSVFVYDTISVNEEVVLGVMVFRLTTSRRPSGSIPLVSVAEYREMLDDHASTDKQIQGRLEYIESLCRSIIRHELKHYGNSYQKHRS